MLLNSSTSKAETTGRLNLLKRVSYLFKAKDWAIAKHLHSAVLAEVEKGDRLWDTIEFGEITSSVLAASRFDSIPASSVVVASAQVHNGQANPANLIAQQGAQALQGGQGAIQQPRQFRQNPRRNRFGQDRPLQTSKFYCGPFNRTACPHLGAHLARVNGTERVVEHICSFCLSELKDSQQHSRKDCPRADKK